MKFRIGQTIPGILAACSLAACVWVLASELAAFRSAVGGWAERDMRARTLLAADALGDAIETGDFRRIREFGDSCRADGARLTILTAPGGVMYDTTPTFGGHRSRPEVEAAISSGVGTAIRRSQTTGEEMFFCAQRSGEHVVRLAIPTSRFYAPFRRARLGLILAGLVGAASFLFIFLFTHQLRARIRERERQLAELQRAERFRSEFIANLTHEIKTPLTGIIGAVDLLDGGDDLPPDSRKTLFGLLRGESVRLNALAQDILELAHLEEQQRDDNASFAPADLSDIARSVQTRLQPKADAADIRLVLGDLPPLSISCDARLVEHALSEVLPRGQESQSRQGRHGTRTRHRQAYRPAPSRHGHARAGCRRRLSLRAGDSAGVMRVLTCLAYNFFVIHLICFRCWESWSLGGLEDFYNFLRNS